MAKSVIETAFNKAAESLSFFLKEEVSAEKSFIFSSEQISTERNTPGQQRYLLSTRIFGDLKGVCFLILSQEEADRIKKESLPQMAVSENKKLEEALLLETDNIISAHAIAQFSRQLQINVFGAPPLLQILPGNLLREQLNKEAGNTSSAFCIKTKFKTHSPGFSAAFIWILESSFVELIRLRAKTDLKD